MRILLTGINAKYVHANLALRYLYAAAKDSCGHLEIREFTTGNEESYLFSEILLGEYDLVCFSCYIWNVERALRLAENLKKAQPEMRILFGGPEAGSNAVAFMKENRMVDFVVAGEGEYAFASLCRALESADAPLEKIKGLVYRKNGIIFVNPPAEPLIFESVPFPYEELPPESDQVAYYESARGCPYRCSYCLSSLDRKIRALSLSRVFREMDYFLERRVPQVKFVDRTFNWDGKRCCEILRYIMDQDNGVTNFHFELRGDLINEELLRIVNRSRRGLFQFEIGIQSTNDDTLAAVNRTAETDIALSGIRKLVETGKAHVHVDLIAGLPLEGYVSFQDSFNRAYALSADMLQLGFLKMLKGTQLRQNAAKYGYVFCNGAPYEVIANHLLSAKDLARLKQIESVLELYYNRGGFSRTLSRLTTAYAPAPFAFFEEFSLYFTLKGYQHRPHKKEDLYRILYEYACWKQKRMDVQDEELFRYMEEDLEQTLNSEAVKRFLRKGWRI